MRPRRTVLWVLATTTAASACYEYRPSELEESQAEHPPVGPFERALGVDVGAPPADEWIPERPAQPPVACEVEPTVECIASFPRVMIIMDASSSMLAGRELGGNNWDKARFAIAGNPGAPAPGMPGYVRPAFERDPNVRGHVVTLEDVFHLGMLAFNAADSQQLVLQYAPCATDNLRWAMDPEVSCEPPGCVDPYRGTTEWTYKSSDEHRRPPFVQTTHSYVPPCNPGGPIECIGTAYNTYTAEALAFARDNVAAYRASAPTGSLAERTRFANILVTDGDTAPDSSPIEHIERLASEGVPTYVIGLEGGFVGSPSSTLATLDSYARAGGTEYATLIEASDEDIADAFAVMVTRVIDELGTDPCCQPTDCSVDPEPRG